MANWAVVIGVDKYWTPEASLKGAVRDALSVREWLLDPAGGNVPASNLALLLSPDATSPAPGVPFTDATYDNVVLAIERVLDRSGAQGERSFFHFSGHGVTQVVNLSSQSAILPTDFRPALSTKSFTLRLLFELFQGTHFEQQFFFIDACRNLALEIERRLGDYPNARQPVPPVSPQFVMYATQPGTKASEVRQPGNERGAFTAALRKGLAGAGAAKRWDDESGDYVVRWNSLFSHVHAQVEALQLAAQNDPEGPPLIQLPTQYGERGGEDPELGRISADAVAKENLEILLDPTSIQDRAQIRVGEILSSPYQHGPPATLPFRLELPPRTYGVRAEATGYRMVKRLEKVELYAPETRTVQLVPLEPRPAPPRDVFFAPPPFASAPPPPEAPPHKGGLGLVPGGGGGGYGGGGSGGGGGGGTARDGKGKITAQSDDPLASLELSDDAGRPIKSGRSPLEAENLRPGFYRARIVSPEGSAVEELVDLEPGSGEISVQLTAPIPTGKAMDWAMQTGGFPVFADGTVGPSESVGPSAFLRLSTMLALAAGASIEGAGAYGDKLRQLGIPAPAFATGAMVLFGDEMLDPTAWTGVTVQWWADRELAPVVDPIAELAGAPGIGYALRPLPSGLHWLWINFVGRAETVVPLAVLPGRLALVVVTREQDGSFDIHQYQPLLDPGAVAVQPPDWKMKDPIFDGSRFAQIRRIELMQRAVSRGRITPTEPDIQQLLLDKWADPVAGCLGGYLLARQGRERELEVPARNLVNYFGELADAHVLMGTYLRARPEEGDARAAFALALERGIPMYRDGLRLLAKAMDEFAIEHARAPLLRAMFEDVPAGSLWSASSDAASFIRARLLSIENAAFGLPLEAFPAPFEIPALDAAPDLEAHAAPRSDDLIKRPEEATEKARHGETESEGESE